MSEATKASSGEGQAEDTVRSTDAEEATCPEGSVPLHQLCENCSRFARTYDFTKWGDSTSHDYYTFCTVSQLYETIEFCHLCRLIGACFNVHGRHDLEQAKADRKIILRMNSGFRHPNMAMTPICTSWKSVDTIKISPFGPSGG